MKKFILALALMCSSAVFAVEVTVVDAALPVSSGYRTLVDARFYVNKDTKEGFVKVAVSEERYMHNGGYPYPGSWPCGGYDQWGRCYPAPRPIPTPIMVLLFEDTVKVDGLMLMDDKVVFHAAEGAVDCGTLGVSRVFKKPTIYLSGKCNLESEVINSRTGSRVVVTLKTK